MKKRQISFAVAGMTVVMTALLTAGCGKKVTPENLLEDMRKNMEEAESVECTMQLGLMLESGIFSRETLVDTEIELKDENAHMVSKTTVRSMDYSEEESETEYYVIRDGEGDRTYACIDGEWYMSDEAINTVDVVYSLQNLAELADSFEVADSHAEVEGKACVVLKGEISREDFAEKVNGDVIDSLAEQGGEENALPEVKIPCTVTIYRESGLPASVYFDMSDVMQTAIDASGDDIDVSDYYAEFTFRGFGGTDEILLPEAAAAAEGGDSYK